MLSKKRADLRANGLLKAARAERERHAARSTRFLVVLFPELSRHAAAKRWAVVQAAREAARSRRLVRAANLAVLVPGAAWIAGVWAGWEAAAVLGWAAAITMLVGQAAQYIQTRREVRALLRPRIHELNRNGNG